ncbi:Phosphoserine aminotransferase [hydrothermal vent metagenome]|uniref:phosphoserine transaminase n=1 Tax=hydrothermal vent metagenome TaxID=652676 RepID=A0A1W1CAQ8_9ZZZZ
MSQAYNFSAGPSMLPESVLKEVQQELLCYKDTKVSIIEMSHRSEAFMQLANEAKQDLKDLMNIPDDYKILFLQGGASAQFSMIPMNLLQDKTKASYVLSGHWSQKAITEAKRFCDVNICTDSSENKFTDIQDFNNWQIDENSAYLHFADNETIAGLEFDYVPEVEMPLVCDMSSNILSKEIDVSKFGMIYAGAQKNIAPAGMTIVIIKKSLMHDNLMAKAPYLYSYKAQYDNDSMFNTPVTFSWYVAAKVFKWLKNNGGLSAMEIVNKRKATKLYQAIDNSDFYHNPVALKYRSKMNIPFILADDNLNDLFLEQAFSENLVALKGHKSVGGMRASIYNAMPEEGVDALIKFMKDFEKKYG